MAINNLGDRIFVNEFSGNRYTEAARKKGPDLPRETSKRDTVSLSSNLKDMQTTMEAVSASEFNPSDIDRDKKVSDIKSQYKYGNYTVKPDAIANKILHIHLSENT